MWRRVNPEERKDVFEDVIFSLAKKEQEQERKQRERNCLYLAKILKRMPAVTFCTTWAEVRENGTFQSGWMEWGGSEILKFSRAPLVQFHHTHKLPMLLFFVFCLFVC